VGGRAGEAGGPGQRSRLRENLIKIRAAVVLHARQVVFQMAEPAVPREVSRAILEGIGRLRSAPGT
jgi:hypothetical protein